eukprot:CAMPEP_0182908858 /NCGR_PEP_ID=MMETSP0034_2-20130328/35435_1 /TAXON_ID=156128 /ORGANISM="Nephroselmis pyriformis, Strain CCMP717" /LENGTH=249 /DNA_ID=CAMNT_0025045063 /DNA_START=74 /DNA_END=820 /DNA_ORIENTATION=+
MIGDIKLEPKLHSLGVSMHHPAHDLITQVDINLGSGFGSPLEFEIQAKNDSVHKLELDTKKLDIDYMPGTKASMIKLKHQLPDLFRGTKLMAIQKYQKNNFKVTPKPNLKAQTSFTPKDGVAVGYNLANKEAMAGGILRIGGKEQCTTGVKWTSSGDLSTKLKYKVGDKYCDMLTAGWFKSGDDTHQTISAHAFPVEGYKVKAKYNTQGTVGSYVRKDTKGAGQEWKVGITAPTDGNKDKITGEVIFKW